MTQPQYLWGQSTQKWQKTGLQGPIYESTQYQKKGPIFFQSYETLALLDHNQIQPKNKGKSHLYHFHYNIINYFF